MLAELGVEYYEALMLDGFEADNVRGLIDLSDRIVTRIARGLSPKSAIDKVFAERFGEPRSAIRSLITGGREGPPPVINKLKAAVKDLYQPHVGNITAIKEALREKDIHVSRRKVAEVVDELGLPRLKKPRE